jgi:hypothetical protein
MRREPIESARRESDLTDIKWGRRAHDPRRAGSGRRRLVNYSWDCANQKSSPRLVHSDAHRKD